MGYLPHVFDSGERRMSGEDQRHSYHEDEISALVDSRVTLEDGRIVEYPPEPEGNPPNVIGGNNADLG
jgi:hypothetical protein